MTIFTHETTSPSGVICTAVHRAIDGAEAIVACGFADHWNGLVARAVERFPDEDWVIAATEPSLAVDAYVGGDLGAIDYVPVDTGGTEFQRRVWTALRTIPLGETWSYGDLAAAVGNGGAMRAVGSANGANPVSVVVPCHRVVRADGSLGGYGGGLDRKAWLLRHEGARLA